MLTQLVIGEYAAFSTKTEEFILALDVLMHLVYNAERSHYALVMPSSPVEHYGIAGAQRSEDGARDVNFPNGVAMRTVLYEVLRGLVVQN
jgi:hypothetical protein